MQLNDVSQSVNEIKNYKFPDESGITSSLFKFNDTVYYSSKENIYQYNRFRMNFQKNNQLNSLISGSEGFRKNDQ